MRASGSMFSVPSASIASTGVGQRVEALEQHVDRVALEAALALAQQLEDVLHAVRERGHAVEAHRRAHALQRVRDAEDLVDRLAVVGRLLDADDGEVELLEVLARLGEEHRQVLGDVHQIFRYVKGWVGARPTAGRIGDALGGPDDQVAAGAQRLGEARVQRVAHLVVEVDDGVAAQHEVVGAGASAARAAGRRPRSAPSP